MEMDTQLRVADGSDGESLVGNTDSPWECSRKAQRTARE